MKVAGEFRVEKVRLAPWWWVAAPTVALDVAQGDAAADGHFAVDMPAGGEAVIRLDKLGLQLRDLALDQRWQQFSVDRWERWYQWQSGAKAAEFAAATPLRR